ncbi:spore cortex biosynthesis protein YabQ [Clostridium sp. 'White wine YQ']|uniref:spore cortex biosynthesis protein YabQ n=1 Tax=Clostridium sp. 'White wine YQ' TaxID=3027474 RepID=UPI0023662367|nr:spore cortex biosynthesis protein YabQ [Clostridium sp. 'White wine YQ']MDD7795050.1 spore cortex biosynthesis protein YabQ [Clostridium sp. 'White wine YQ']
MLLPNNIQYNIIIYSLLAGMLTGILFDAYRIIRGSGINKVIIVFEDLLFGILGGLAIFTFLLYYNSAFLGFYVYCGIIIGFILYLRLISKYILRFEKVLLSGVNKFFRMILINVIYIFKIIFYKILGKSK